MIVHCAIPFPAERGAVPGFAPGEIWTLQAVQAAGERLVGTTHPALGTVLEAVPSQADLLVGRWLLILTLDAERSFDMLLGISLNDFEEPSL